MNRICILIAGTLLTLTACSSSNGSSSSNEEDAVIINGDVATDGLFGLPDGESDGEPAGDSSTTNPDEVPSLDAVTTTDVNEDTGGGGGGGEGGDRYDDCGFTNGCADPYTCIGNCHLPCDEGCPEDEECLELGGGFGVCGHVVDEGEDCDLRMARICEDELFCNDDDVCEAPEVGGEGAPCGGRESCEDGTMCISTGGREGICHRECEDTCDLEETCVGGDGGGACFVACDPESDDNLCPEGYICREQLGGGDVACLPDLGGSTGTGGEFADACGGGSSCSGDLFCPPGIEGAYCTGQCEEASDCPGEPSGATCESFGWGPGICAFLCETEGEDGPCPDGMHCRSIFGAINLCTH